MQPTETTRPWVELTDSDKQLVIEIHCMGYKTLNKRAMRIVFDTGQPAITFGTKQGKQYCHVVAADVYRVKFLINTIL
jgi:hypothetical protein